MLNAIYLQREYQGTSYAVVAFADPRGETKLATWPAHYTKSKPKHGSKYVTLNCARFPAVWIADRKEYQK
jgi:hypothetical protein